MGVAVQDPRVVQVPLLPKQLEFLAAQEREVIYSGALGAGKTRALCLKAAMRACGHPNAVELLVRKTNVTLKKSTLRTLLKPDGDLPPVLPPGSYRHNKSEQTISLLGGGDILYFGIDDPLKIGSIPATGVNIDEATELDEDDYRMLRGRARVKVAGLPRQVNSATNPGAPSHHLAKRFGLAPSTVAAPNTRAIMTCSDDNFFLPRDYLDDLHTFKGHYRQRYLEGLWVQAEGLVYPGLLDCFVAHTPKPPGVDVGGVDFGWANPFCALGGTIFEAEDGGQALYVHWEHYVNKTPLPDHAEAMLDAFPYNETIWAADPEDPESIRNLQLADLRVVKAINHVRAGITAVNGLISAGRLYISAACENLKREAELYAWDLAHPEKEKPAPGEDHAMSALRYLVMLVRHRRLMSWVAGMPEEEL